jgi:hypothetical protein
MRGDGQDSFRPRKSSWSWTPWWIAAALLFGIALGARLTGNTRFDGHAYWPEKPVDALPRKVEPSTDSGSVNKPSAQPRNTPSAVSRHDPYEPPRHETPRPAATREVYLCKGYAGSMFWSSSSCASQRASIDRIATVPGHLDWDQAVAEAERQRRAAAALYAAPNMPRTAGAITHATASPASNECAALDTYVQRLDDAARQPQGPQSQDRLREERRRARIRQAALHC